MSKNTNTKTPSPNNPSCLKPRYEIRKLGPEHERWATAIVAHSNIFYSPVWSVIYPKNLNERYNGVVKEAAYLVNHQIDSGLSYGVFDTEYEYQTEEAKQAGGKFYFDPSEPSIEETEGQEAEATRTLKQMDFPLVSVALSYDASNPIDMGKMGPLMGTLPHFGIIYQNLLSADTRDPATWQPTGPCQVLFRNATSTRRDYEGQGIMGGLARWLMREADQLGFRGIQIECVNDAVTHVWSEPEPPYKGAIVSEFHTTTWKNEAGELAFAPSDQQITKCYVDLKPAA